MARNLTGSQAGFPGYVAADTYYSDPATAVVPDSMHNEHLLGVIAYVLENLGAGGGGGGDALVANPLSQFAATTSAQLRGVLSDETGTGLAYFQGGDIGTPSAGVGTNLTGTAAGLTAGNVTTNANLTGPVTSTGNATAIANNAILVAMAEAKIKHSVLGITIDGGGSTITTGIKGSLEIPYDCTITSATLAADASGSIVIDVWKDTYANYPPTVADTITAAAKPTITTATKSTDATLTGWTTTLAKGDILRFNVDSVDTHKLVTLTLQVTKT